MDRVNWVTHECFNALRQLRKLAASSSADGQLLYTRTSGFVDAMLRKAAQAGYGNDDARSMAYAIVALADEIAMASAGPVRDHWARRPLQLAYFNENVAGENFFAHLDQLRRTTARVDVLRVYYLCLLLGFQGRHKVRGGDVGLSDLTESVRQELARSLDFPEFLSPDGQRPEESVLLGVKRLPTVWIGASLLVLAGVLYLGLQVSLRADSDSLLGWMTDHARLAQGAATP